MEIRDGKRRRSQRSVQNRHALVYGTVRTVIDHQCGLLWEIAPSAGPQVKTVPCSVARIKGFTSEGLPKNEF